MRNLLIALALAGCNPAEETVSPFADLSSDAHWPLGLSEPAHVVTLPMGVPYVYAANERDLATVQGFVMARDRFFYMDLNRRLSTGRIAALLGDAALEFDVESRMTGQAFVVDRVVQEIQGDPALTDLAEGFAAGVNAYIASVKAGDLEPPTEYADPLIRGLLGAETAGELMEDFGVYDVAAGLVTVIYQTDFETKDVGRTDSYLRLQGTFDGAPLEAQRKAGLLDDVWGRSEPLEMVASAPDWVLDAPAPVPPGPRNIVGVHPDALTRLARHADQIETRLGHDLIHGWGSNAWAVAGTRTDNGNAMMASDGHLPLTVPALLYQMGLNTSVLGENGTSQVGLMVPGMPVMGVGTNGKVAWGQTNLVGDITDWYGEEIQLDAAGAPAAARFGSAWEPLVATTESVDIAEVVALGSTARTESFVRYTTSDGKWLTSIEGRQVSGPTDAGEGETAVNMMGDWIIPADLDGDEIISAIAFDYAGLDTTSILGALRQSAMTNSVEEFKEVTKDFVAYGLNLVVADDSGSILYTGFQPVPCRDYLDRHSNRNWTDGSDPNMLLDGTRYRGFTIPHEEGHVVFGDPDPYHCVISYDDYPHSLDPEQGMVATANNDPGGMSFDGSLANDRVYIGGPWFEGQRADEILRELESRGNAITAQDMQTIQGDHTSVVARRFAEEVLVSVDHALALDGELAGADQRIAAAIDGRADELEAVRDRLRAWGADGGWEASSGVDTFYSQATAQDRENAVATMIFNVWFGRYLQNTVNDEGFPGLGWPSGDTSRLRLLTRMLSGRGADNPEDLSSWSAETQESVYFDDIRTPEIESSHEIAIRTLLESLDYLASEPEGPGQGGFGTDQMDEWLWGLRHHVRFTSLLGDFLGDDEFGFLVEKFNITPDRFPVAEGLDAADPRASLPGFPRPGDNNNVDAADGGFGGRDFDYDYGPVNRFVVSLGPGGFEGYSVIPGGQSGVVDHPNFDDQVKLWLGNEALPIYLDVGDVVANAERYETFGPQASE